MKITTVNYLLGRRSLTRTREFIGYYTIVPPSPQGGHVGVESQSFSVTPSITFTGTITPDDDHSGGTFSPTSLSWSNSSVTKTFTYTPVVIGSIPIEATNNVGLTNPAPVFYLSFGASAVQSAVGGWLLKSVVSLGSDNAQIIKAAPGVVGTVTCFNISASPIYLKFYNKVTAPNPSSDTPIYVCPMPGNTNGAGSVVQMEGGIFDVGIGIAIVTGIASNDNTSTGAGDCVVSIGYR